MHGLQNDGCFRCEAVTREIITQTTWAEAGSYLKSLSFALDDRCVGLGLREEEREEETHGPIIRLS